MHALTDNQGECFRRWTHCIEQRTGDLNRKHKIIMVFVWQSFQAVHSHLVIVISVGYSDDGVGSATAHGSLQQAAATDCQVAGQTPIPEGDAEWHCMPIGAGGLHAGQQPAVGPGELCGQVQLTMDVSGLLIHYVELHLIATACGTKHRIDIHTIS